MFHLIISHGQAGQPEINKTFNQIQQFTSKSWSRLSKYFFILFIEKKRLVQVKLTLEKQ